MKKKKNESTVAQTKAWRPKSKTGCITCRIRRIKCDEAKPNCQRCSSTGRKCDGYQGPATIPERSLVIGNSPSLNQGSQKELESLGFFSSYTANDFAGFFDDEFWTRGVLQASQMDPTVRHLVTALGAMHRRFLICDVPVLPGNLMDNELRFALEQCNSAIQRMLRQSKASSQAWRTTALISSLLLICFSSIQGHQLQALSHLRCGLAILQETKSSPSSTSVAYPIEMETLNTMFTCLDVQARSMLSREMLDEWNFRTFSKPADVPPCFKSWIDARVFFESALDNLLRLLQDLEKVSHHPHTPEQESTAFGMIQSQKDHFLAGEAEMVTFLRRATEPPSEKERTNRSVQQLFASVTHIFFTVFPLMKDEGEEAWDCCEELFANIISEATQLLDTASSRMALKEYVRRPPLFSFGFGVVQPLFVLASRCRNPIMRRKAIDLLLHHPRREGIWDSVLAGKLARQAMLLEESASNIKECDLSLITAAHVKGGARIRDSVITYVGLRSAEVVFNSVDNWLKGEAGVKILLEW